jgi:hypothetical protein
MPKEPTPLGDAPQGPSSDPKRLRALAHPLRWKLIDLLDSEESATATRCSEVLGESVASCSYHLGILGKYGYVERVLGQPGRDKPWRLADRQQMLSCDGTSLEAELAAEAATEAFLDHEFARAKDRLRRRDHEPAEWRDASGMLGSTVYVTADELREISDQLTRIAVRYRDRQEDPALRPEGARLARVFAMTSVAPPQSPAPRG